MGLQVGAITPAFYGFRDREYVLNLIEAVTGGRFHPNFNRIGGIKDDLPWGWISECRSVMQKVLDSRATSSTTSCVGNPIFQKRTRSIGIIPPELGAAYGVSGSNLRASGVDWDLRRDGQAYLVYDELDWKVWTHPDGDSFARYWVRLQETRESARMVLQMLDRCRAARSWRRCRASSRCRRVRCWSTPRTRSARWATTSSRRARPARSAPRSAPRRSATSRSCRGCCKGVYVPDIVTILAGLYFILGDIDR